MTPKRISWPLRLEMGEGRAGRDENAQRAAHGVAVDAMSGPIYTFEGKTPLVHASAWVAPTAAVIGDVEIGANASIWYHCVLRGDTNTIRIGPRTNIQDGTIIHVNAGRQSTIIGADVTVGHAAIIHACRLEDRAFVGMGATVLDDAVIEAGGVLAAGSVLPPGKRVAALELWMGNPAKLVRLLTEEARAGFDRTAPHYVELARRHRSIS